MNRPQPQAPFVIGPGQWAGLAKLIEECGELIQVAGKLIAYPDGDHPDGEPLLQERLMDEIADVQAAADFVTHNNPLDLDRIDERVHAKFVQFTVWHQQAMASESEPRPSAGTTVLGLDDGLPLGRGV